MKTAAEVLEASKIVGMRVLLPDGEIAEDILTEVYSLLFAAGARKQRGKKPVVFFPRPAEAYVAGILVKLYEGTEGGAPDRSQALGGALVAPIALEDAMKDPAGFAAGFEEVGSGTGRIPNFPPRREVYDEQEQSDLAAAGDPVDLAAEELRREFPREDVYLGTGHLSPAADPYLAEMGDTLETVAIHYDTAPEGELLKIDVELIDPSPSNPRKLFDMEEILELAESIALKGVIQPVLVRIHPTIPGRYQLVAGERRWRASKLAAIEKSPKAAKIPAYCRPISDDEVLDLQITENLERKDIHPMEEAVSFKTFLEKMSIEELAARLAKKPHFVRQRLKLNDLAEVWQTAFYHDQINLPEALKIAILPKDTQINMGKTKGAGEDHHRIEFSSWDFRDNERPLLKAPFDLKNPTLVKRMGACTTCPFNTAVAALFPEDETNPVCKNPSCFKAKVERHLVRELAVVKKRIDAGEDIVLLHTFYGNQSSDVLKKLREEGYTVLAKGKEVDYHIDKRPTPPTMADAADAIEHEFEDHIPESALRQAFTEALADYEKSLAEFDDLLKKPGRVLAFVVAGGEYDGSYVIAKKVKEAKSVTKDKLAAGTASSSDLKDELKRLDEVEKRKKEIDGEKILARSLEVLPKDVHFTNTDTALKEADMVALIIALADAAPHETVAVLRKMIGLRESDYNYRQVFDKLSGMTMAELYPVFNKFARAAVFARLKSSCGTPPNPVVSGKAAALQLLADAYCPAETKLFKVEQAEVTEKRLERYQKKVDDLKRQIDAKARPAKKADKKDS